MYATINFLFDYSKYSLFKSNDFLALKVCCAVRRSFITDCLTRKNHRAKRDAARQFQTQTFYGFWFLRVRWEPREGFLEQE